MFFLCVSFKIWLPDLFFRELKQPWCLAHASVHCPAYSTNQTELLSPTPGVAGMPSVEPLCQGCPGAVTVTHGRYPLPTNQGACILHVVYYPQRGIQIWW